jgi:hypothetical protein
VSKVTKSFVYGLFLRCSIPLGNAGVAESSITSLTTVARSAAHCSIVIGLSLMMYLPRTCSTFWTSRQCSGSVLQPNKRSSNISWNVFLVVDDDRLFAPSRHEDFDGIVVIAEATLVERTLNALISP